MKIITNVLRGLVRCFNCHRPPYEIGLSAANRIPTSPANRIPASSANRIRLSSANRIPVLA